MNLVHLGTFLSQRSFAFCLIILTNMINTFCFSIAFIYFSFEYNLNSTNFAGLSTRKTNCRFFRIKQDLNNVLCPKQIISIRRIFETRVFRRDILSDMFLLFPFMIRSIFGRYVSSFAFTLELHFCRSWINWIKVATSNDVVSSQLELTGGPAIMKGSVFFQYLCGNILSFDLVFFFLLKN